MVYSGEQILSFKPVFKSLPVHSLNALIIPILRDCLQSLFFPLGFEGRMWDLIVSVPDHCLSFLLCTSEHLWLCYVVALKSLPVHSFNALVIPILRGCLQSLFIPFGFAGRMWDLIVSVPDHCLSFYFVLYAGDSLNMLKLYSFWVLVHNVVDENDWFHSLITWVRKVFRAKLPFFCTAILV